VVFLEIIKNPADWVSSSNPIGNVGIDHCRIDGLIPPTAPERHEYLSRIE